MARIRSRAQPPSDTGRLVYHSGEHHYVPVPLGSRAVEMAAMGYLRVPIIESGLKASSHSSRWTRGFGFLGLTPVGFAPVSFAAASVIGATWRHEILHHGANLMSFKLPAIVLVGIIGLIAFGPLAFFVPRLAVLRRQGILEFGTLGQIHSINFHEKWIRQQAGHEAEFLTAPESSMLADYGQSYDGLNK